MKNTEAEIVKSESIKKQDSQKIESEKKVEQIKRLIMYGIARNLVYNAVLSKIEHKLKICKVVYR